MALLKCPECQGAVSSEAHTCPHCGYPLKKVEPKKAKTPSLPDSGSGTAGKQTRQSTLKSKPRSHADCLQCNHKFIRKTDFSGSELNVCVHCGKMIPLNRFSYMTNWGCLIALGIAFLFFLSLVGRVVDWFGSIF